MQINMDRFGFGVAKSFYANLLPFTTTNISISHIQSTIHTRTHTHKHTTLIHYIPQHTTTYMLQYTYLRYYHLQTSNSTSHKHLKGHTNRAKKPSNELNYSKMQLSILSFGTSQS